MEILTIVGFTLALGAILLGQVLEGGHVGSIMCKSWDLPVQKIDRCRRSSFLVIPCPSSEEWMP